MIVDDVEDDGEAEAVRRVDERAHVARCAVGMKRRIGEDTVVAPAETANELGDGQKLDDGYAELREMRQFADRGTPCPLEGEGPDMELIDDVALLARPAPTTIGPTEFWVDNLARPSRSIRLAA